MNELKSQQCKHKTYICPNSFIIISIYPNLWLCSFGQIIRATQLAICKGHSLAQEKRPNQTGFVEMRQTVKLHDLAGYLRDYLYFLLTINCYTDEGTDLGMSLNCLHRVIFLLHPGANDP